MEPKRSGTAEASSARAARRLLWGLIIGVVVLNLLIFLATMRPGAE